jgi:predicted AlkP superfamily phosphohydrolase/phosphomutase
MSRPLLVLGLDGYEPTVAEQLLADGGMPNLRALIADSTQCQLDHGEAKRSGLAWEHFSLGREPAAYGRHAAVHFDPRTYGVTQEGTSLKPFIGDVDRRVLIFNAPYFDMLAAPNCEGLVSWGAHDAGVGAQCAPAGLSEEVEAKFGPYPATPYIYGFVWPDPEKTRDMADAMVRAVEQRSAIGHWLCTERLPDWDMAVMVICEFHSAIEGLWHGYDASHPLHHLPSAPAARDGIIGVYEAFDRLLGLYRRTMPEVDFAVFSMHGMGANDSDVPTMALLPELLYRTSFGKGLLEPRADWRVPPGAIPMLGPSEKWSGPVRACLRHPLDSVEPPERSTLDWMPAAMYRRYWPAMEAFALPSYYDGRIRVNLAGRERDGRVSLAAYNAKLDEICALLEECRDPRTGAPVVASIARPVASDPLRAGPTEADLVVIWRGSPLALQHKRLGLIGPIPFRRTGGHTGSAGIAYLTSSKLVPGDIGMVSAFDVVPTLIELLEAPLPGYLSGHSFVGRAKRNGPA